MEYIQFKCEIASVQRTFTFYSIQIINMVVEQTNKFDYNIIVFTINYLLNMIYLCFIYSDILTGI